LGLEQPQIYFEGLGGDLIGARRMGKSMTLYGIIFGEGVLDNAEASGESWRQFF
jgi:hypothetical protein